VKDVNPPVSEVVTGFCSLASPIPTHHHAQILGHGPISLTLSPQPSLLMGRVQERLPRQTHFLLSLSHTVPSIPFPTCVPPPQYLLLPSSCKTELSGSGHRAPRAGSGKAAPDVKGEKGSLGREGHGAPAGSQASMVGRGEQRFYLVHCPRLAQGSLGTGG
jgi:hypothetical protein